MKKKMLEAGEMECYIVFSHFHKKSIFRIRINSGPKNAYLFKSMHFFKNMVSGFSRQKDFLLKETRIMFLGLYVFIS